MKALVFILLFAPLIGSSQIKTPIGLGIVSDWKIYLSDCNTLVPDTVIQSGTVNVEYKPVMADGKISHFILAPIDTVWSKIECQEYKYFDFNGSAIEGNHFYSGWTTFTSNYAVMAVPATTYSTPEAKSKIDITRKKICQIKKRKASWDDFWNRWCKEKKIIEFN